MSQDFVWLTEQSRDIFEKYSGKWIAVPDSEVIRVGPPATDAARQAEASLPGTANILEVVESEPERI